MNRLARLLSFAALAFAVYYSLDHQRPDIPGEEKVPAGRFSTMRALVHVKEMSKAPHYCGTAAHTQVRDYIAGELEKMGLDVQIQKQEAFWEKWKAGVTAQNVLARIEGEKEGKALLLLSHYDSSPASSLGASDDASGVATILEGIRAFLAKGEKPENDIIILFSDAEELGLVGAKAFTAFHPWVKDVGLVINFEARGSGGPSYLLLETNRGNAGLVRAVAAAGPSYPVGNSLLYSIYKMLPNDTDLTVFREDADIDGINLAFIDDFFDYHSAQDSYERLDRRTLAHNGTYLTALLDYFSRTPLEKIRSGEDNVFFNAPGFGLVYYPFSAVLPSAVLLLVVFIILLAVAIRQKRIRPKDTGTGALRFFTALVASLVTGIGGWKLLQIIFPSFQDILQGYPYQSHSLMFVFSGFLMWILFRIYKNRGNETPVAAWSVSPIFAWLLLNLFFAVKLPGGGFFIMVPLAAIILWVYETFTDDKKYPVLFYTLLLIPVLLVFIPLIVMFPVGLGMKAIVVTLFFIMMITTSFWGLFSRFGSSVRYMFLLISVIAFVSVWQNNSYTPGRKKPTGVFYVHDLDTGKAYFAGYSEKTDSYTRQFFGDEARHDSFPVNFYNKFNNLVRTYTETEARQLPPPEISHRIDTVRNNPVYHLTLRTRRNANLFYLVTAYPVQPVSVTCNGIPYHPGEKSKTSLTTGKVTNFLSYWLTPGSGSLHIEYRTENNEPAYWELYEIKFDLHDNPEFDIHPRNDKQMPMPFVINDATVLKKVIKENIH